MLRKKMQEEQESEVLKPGLAETEGRQVPLILEAMLDVAGKKSGQAWRGRTMVSELPNLSTADENEK